MTITFVRIDPASADRQPLIAFLTRNTFPFHVGTSLSAEKVERAIAEGAYHSDQRQSFWVAGWGCPAGGRDWTSVNCW